MKTPYRSILSLVGSLLAAGVLAGQTAKLTILHTNDTHGHLLPFSYPNLVPKDSVEAQLSARTDIGGIARRATLIKKVKADLGKQPVWAVDLGDFCDGTPFSTEFHGDADNEAMNAVGYDFGVLGNHEFNNTYAQLSKLIADSKRKLLCANATVKATGKSLLPESVIVNAGPVKVGLFGLITEDARTYPAAKDDVSIADEVATASRMVNELKPKVDIVIMLTHIGVENDEAIAKKVPGIDVIIGGHSHTRLPVGKYIGAKGSGTIVAQAFQWGGELGQLDLTFEQGDDKKWRVSDYRAKLLPITAQLEPDTKVAAAVDKYWSKISAKYGEAIGTALEDITEVGDDLANYNLVADAVRETFGTDFEFENLGGVRAPICKGKITVGDVVTVDPFNNSIVTFELTGKEIKEILQRSKPAVSGIRYKTQGRQLLESTINGQPIDDEKTYKGAANSYFAGSQMKSYKDKITDTGKGRLQTIIDYIRKLKEVKPLYDGRRVVK